MAFPTLVLQPYQATNVKVWRLRYGGEKQMCFNVCCSK
jgi:hypothetical protein